MPAVRSLPIRRLRRRLTIRAAVAATTLIAVAGCASSSGHSLIGDTSPIGNEPLLPPSSTTTTAAPATTAAPTTSSSAAPVVSTTSAAPAPQPPRPYPVGWTTLDLTDPSRPTGSKPGRHLPTLVFYPAVGAGPASETQGAAGLYHSWPLVVFAHGYNTAPLTYHDYIHHLASAGFVVAAPSFPLETAGGPLDENDLNNEPQDIKFVITQVLGAGSRPGVLDGLIDPARIALAGHSDGGEAVVGAAYLAGVADVRVGPVIAMSAQGILNPSGLSRTQRHELLVIQGTADTINPPSRGDRLFAMSPSPKSYLQLLGAGHLPPIADSNQWRPVVEAVSVDWLDAWLGGLYGGSAAGRLGHDGNVPGTAQFQLG